jgi:hypothetical protein
VVDESTFRQKYDWLLGLVLLVCIGCCVDLLGDES